MTPRPSNENQDRLRKAARERAAAKARLPLSDEQFEALFDALDDGLQASPCDHSFRLTEAHLRAHGIPAEPVLAWLRDNGGFCDCEALASAEEAWTEARDA